MDRRPVPALWLLLCSLAAGCVACSSGATTGPAAVISPATPAAPPRALPAAAGSLKLAVIGDFGNGSRAQHQLADQMAALRSRFPFEIVLTVGDNIYGSERPRDMVRKFEAPYKALLGAGVKFYASLGNHDNREQRFYEHFNMNGRLYYTFKGAAQDVRFFALESGYLEPKQIAWLESELSGSNEAWKIAYFHHPLYSSGGRHGSDLAKREVLEPLFIKHGVSVVFTGHDHVYERTEPQNGIVYFVVGSSGQLRRGNLRRSPITAAGNDRDQIFLAAEILGDQMYFNAITRTGQIADSGVILRRRPQP